MGANNKGSSLSSNLNNLEGAMILKPSIEIRCDLSKCFDPGNAFLRDLTFKVFGIEKTKSVIYTDLFYLIYVIYPISFEQIKIKIVCNTLLAPS